MIPLAKKLDECGVFGVSSHEYLSYAETNRREWHQKGKSIVEELAGKVRAGQRRSAKMLRRLSSGMRQVSSRTLTRQNSVKARPGGLGRASRTASMRSLMEKVWKQSDALDGPFESREQEKPTEKSYDVVPNPSIVLKRAVSDEKVQRLLTRTKSSENMRFT